VRDRFGPGLRLYDGFITKGAGHELDSERGRP
jgi:hypothetical protein